VLMPTIPPERRKGEAGAGPIGQSETLKLLRVREELAAHSREPGAALDAGKGLFAAARGTALRLLEVQAPGKRAMSFEDFARGKAGLLAGGPRLVSAASVPAGASMAQGVQTRGGGSA
jgi:hypothetical protein